MFQVRRDVQSQWFLCDNLYAWNVWQVWSEVLICVLGGWEGGVGQVSG